MTVTETRSLRDRALTEHAEELNQRMASRLDWLRKVEAESAAKAVQAVRQVLPADVEVFDGHPVGVLGTDETSTTCELEVDGIWFRVVVHHQGSADIYGNRSGGADIYVIVEGVASEQKAMSWEDVRELQANGCPFCHGRFEVELPKANRGGDGEVDVDIEEHPCPLCRPWPQGFPGYSQSGRPLISAYGPGERGEWMPMESF